MLIPLCHLLLHALNTAVKRYFHKRGQRRVRQGRKNMFACVQAQTYTNTHTQRLSERVAGVSDWLLGLAM